MREQLANSAGFVAARELAAYFDQGTYAHATQVSDMNHCRPARAGGDGRGVKHDVICARCLEIWPCERWLRWQGTRG